MVWIAGAGALWIAIGLGLNRRERTLAAGEDRLRLSRDVLAGGILFLLVIGFFWRTVSGDVFQPADGGDLVSFLFPTYRFAARTLVQGDLPLWNPHLYGGAPFISDIQAGFLYLPNLLLFLIDPQFDYTAMQWLAIGHLYWAGLGLYVLLRLLKPGGDMVARPAALFGGLAFALCDPLFLHLGNLNLIAVLSWMPWTFAAFALALHRRSLRWTAITALFFAAGTYAGHAQSSYYVGMALGIFALGRTAAGWSRTGGWTLRRSGRLWPLVALTMVGGLTFLLCAPIVLPTWEMTEFTARAELSYQETTTYSLAPTQAAVGLVTPSFFGRGPALHWSLWDRVETPFTGVSTLLLAVGAFFWGTPRVRRDLWIWLVLALFSLLTALGVYALLHGWLTVLLPGYDQFRAPARAIVLWAFAVSVLGGVGLDQAVRALDAARVEDAIAPREAGSGAGRGYLRFLAAGGLILGGVGVPLTYYALLTTRSDGELFLHISIAALATVFAAVAWLITWALLAALRAGWIGGALFSSAMIALLFFDYSSAGAYTDISPADPTRGFDHPEIIAYLRADPDSFRIDTRTEIAELWQPDAAALHGLDDVWGVANPLLLSHWSALWEATGGRQTRLYDMLNVKYVLVRTGTPLPEGKFTPVMETDQGLTLYQNQGFLPRAWLVDRVVFVPPGTFDTADLHALFAAHEIDPTRAALVEGITAPEPASIGEGASAGTAKIVEQTTSHLTVAVNAVTPALLMLSEVWYPGWRAEVNGAVVEVLRANGALRAVQVPAGESTVSLHFAPRGWQTGLIALLAGLLLSMGLIVAGDRPRRGETGEKN